MAPTPTLPPSKKGRVGTFDYLSSKITKKRNSLHLVYF